LAFLQDVHTFDSMSGSLVVVGLQRLASRLHRASL